TGADVERQPFLGDDPHDRLAQERLSGVVHLRAGECLLEAPAAGPEIGFVENVRGCAVFLRDMPDVHAADVERAVLTADGLWPEAWYERIDVVRRAQPRRTAR